VITNWLWQLKQGKTIQPSILEKALDVIERNTALQTRLVDDLLDVSRAAAGKLSIESKLVELDRLAASVIEVAQPLARAKSIRLSLDAAEHLRIWGDYARLQQVLLNVVDNGMKFTAAGGSVNLRVARDGSRAVIEVADNGAGVPADFLPHMFERFRQGDASMTRRQGGLGIGLSIVREIMALHGGTVNARSAGLNQGTTIRLEFAVADQLNLAGEQTMQPRHADMPVH